MNSRLERTYVRLLGELYVKDGDEYITAFEASHWLPRDCNLTDCYEEVYTLDEETGKYEIDTRGYEDLYDVEAELFGETEDYEEEA